jgi:uncharacterized protein YggU (UPF0235/DUF167 family)
VRSLRVTVKPNARIASLTELDDGSWRATVRERPKDGEANEALIRLVAEHFGVPRRLVSIKSGAGARVKTVVIGDA